MKRSTLFLLLTLCIFRLSAQPSWKLAENSNWKFFQWGGVRFNNNNPTADTSAMKLYYADTVNNVPVNTMAISCATVSDRDGNLLFYTDAYNVWDCTHKLMPNGKQSLLTGNAMDAAFILPSISNANQYYIFHMAGDVYFMFPGTPNAYQLYYTVVDMSLNGGMGDVVDSLKNVLVDQQLSGPVKAVPGDNCNIWIITHDIFETRFKVFELNATGVQKTPIVSNVGNGQAGMLGELSFGGNLALSHDGKKVAFAQNSGDFIPILELFDFNTANGTLSNATVVDTLAFIFNYSLCFSPNNSKLYLSMLNPGEIYPDNPYNLHIESSLFQYDVTKGGAGQIQASRVLISDSISSYNNVMRMGPDGKIYLPSSYGNDTSSAIGYFYPSWENPSTYQGSLFHAYLGCIQNPDEAGKGSNFNRRALPLKNYSSGAETLGGIFVKPIPADTIVAVVDTAICNQSDPILNVQVDTASQYFEWENGDTVTHRTLTETGIYWLRQGNFCHFRVDTFKVNIEDVSAVIAVEGLELRTTVAYASYQWLLNDTLIPGATNQVLQLSKNGFYRVVVRTAGGCIDTSDVYEVTNLGVNDLYDLSKILRIYPNPASDVIYISGADAVDVCVRTLDGRTLKQFNQIRTISSKDWLPGVYLLYIFKPDGTLLKVEKLVRQTHS